MSEAFDILKAEIAARNNAKGQGGITAVAKLLGYARSTVFVAINGHYVGPTTDFEKRVLEVFKDRVECPFAGAIISRDECKAQRKTSSYQCLWANP